MLIGRVVHITAQFLDFLLSMGSEQYPGTRRNKVQSPYQARNRSTSPRHMLPRKGSGYGISSIVLFRPGLAWKPWLWLGLRGLWLHQTLGQAKAANQGLALAWLGLGPGFIYKFLHSIYHRLGLPSRWPWAPI